MPSVLFLDSILQGLSGAYDLFDGVLEFGALDKLEELIRDFRPAFFLYPCAKHFNQMIAEQAGHRKYTGWGNYHHARLFVQSTESSSCPTCHKHCKLGMP